MNPNENYDIRYVAKNSVTGLYFNGLSFCDKTPTKQFDRVQMAWIKYMWLNTVAEVISE